MEHAIKTFEATVRHVATTAIPCHSVKRNQLILPPKLANLLKLKNHYRRRYQRTRLPLYQYLFQLLAYVFNTQLIRLRISKWTAFLGKLHPQTSQYWKVTRYFTTTTHTIPPLLHQGEQIFHSAD